MKDIRTTKIHTVKNENNETKNIVSFEKILVEKTENFVFGKIIFSSFCLSIAMYLFFVTSTVYYSVNTQKFVYNIESLNNVAVQAESLNSEILNNKKDRISFINKNSDTAISLK